MFTIFFFQAEDGIRYWSVTGVQTCALPISLPRILPIEDAEASDVLTKSFRKRGITVLAGAKVLKAAVGAAEVTLDVEAGGKTAKVTVEKVLLAAGRAVNTQGNGFKESGVQLTHR